MHIHLLITSERRGTGMHFDNVQGMHGNIIIPTWRLRGWIHKMGILPYGSLGKKHRITSCGGR